MVHGNIQVDGVEESKWKPNLNAKQMTILMQP